VLIRDCLNRGFSLKTQATSYEEAEIENDFQKKCRKGAKFAAHTAFSAILGEVSCLFSLALVFFTRFRGGSFQPLTHLSASDKAVSSQPSAKADSSAFALLSVGMTKNRALGLSPTTDDQRLTTISKERLQ
jgi:hypothetical protein